ncbi:MAG: helix-turn-helix domain-containing protein [Anaerolineales bacterium]|nr:helix-turn-helix domain-containing protein [Anaerolineales bacterium]
MDIQAQITIRMKKLGVLIRDVRLKTHKSLGECASAIGVSSGVFRSFEQGRKAPSLPELEVLAFSLNLPIDHFWGKDALSDGAISTESHNIIRLTELRHRMIGAQLRQLRMNAGISIKALAGQVGFPSSRLKAYELGYRPIPLPELECIISVLGARIDTFFDQSGPVGKWITSKQLIEKFLQLPIELREFVSQPVNRPYLELAKNLSQLPSEKLRSVAEGLLDITL